MPGHAQVGPLQQEHQDVVFLDGEAHAARDLVPYAEPEWGPL
jgi:hypothetical protein